MMEMQSNISPSPRAYLDGYLTTGQAARKLRRAPGTLQNWRVEGKGPAFVRHGRSIYYALEAIIAYKEKHFRSYASTAEYKAEEQGRKA